MTEAQRTTLLKQIHSGKVKSDKSKILYFIYDNKETGIITLEFHFPEMEKSTITARCSELLNEGLIYVSKTYFEGGQTYSLFDYESNVIKQEENRLNQRKQKFELWKKRAIQFAELMSEEEKSFFGIDTI